MTASAVAAEQHFATKADLQGAIGEIKGELGETRGEMRHFATKADLQGAIGELKAELRAMELRLMIRLGGLIIALTGLLFALQKLWP